MKKFVSLLFIVIFSIMVGIQISNAEGTSDIEIIRNRMIDELAAPTMNPTQILGKWNTDGSFIGINYGDTSTFSWSPLAHLDYVLTLCQVVSTPSNQYYNDSTIISKVISSLDYWVNNNIQSTNWWYQQIAVPLNMSKILLIKPIGISETTLSKMLELANKGSVFITSPPVGALEREFLHTGGNLTDQIISTLRIAVASNDDEAIMKIKGILENELRFYPLVSDVLNIVDSEGLKADFSFHQHENMLNFGGYGQVFILDLNLILSYIKDTKYMLADKALDTYADFLLDGIQWAFRGNYIDYTTIGRSIARPSGLSATAYGIRTLTGAGATLLLAQPNITRRNDLQQMLNERIVTEGNFSGNRHYWLSDYMSHKRPEFHYSIKTTSTRMKATESSGGENLLGYYLGDGAVNILQQGDEYYDIFPAWDWNKVPGTTTAQGGLKTIADIKLKGNTDFVGGVTDGSYGLNAFDYSKDDVSAKKAWFMFDEGVLSLGAGINSTTDMNIYTSINQCNLKGSVVVSSNGTIETIPTGRRTVTSVDWVLHNGVGYIFPNKDDLDVKNQSTIGKWSTISTPQSTANVTKNIFMLGMDHGITPDNANYEYMTLMNTTQTGIQSFISNNPITILQNTQNVQAVWHNGIKMLQAAFWNQGSITAPNGMIITVDKPCLLLFQEIGDNYKVHLSNPLNQQIDVNVDIDGNIQNNIRFRLPSGEYAGSSAEYDSTEGFVEVIGTYPQQMPKDNYVPTNATLTATFNKDMNTETLNENSIILTKKSDGSIQNYNTFNYNPTTRIFSIDLTNIPLDEGTSYLLTVNTNVRDSKGYSPTREYVIEFMTDGMLEPTYNFPLAYDYITGINEIENLNGKLTYMFGGWRNSSAVGSASEIVFGTFDDGKVCRITTKPGETCQLRYLSSGLPSSETVIYTPVRSCELTFKLSTNISGGKIDGMGYRLTWDATINKYLLGFNIVSPWYYKTIAYISPEVKYTLKYVTETRTDGDYLIAVYLNGVRLTNAPTVDNTPFPISGVKASGLVLLHTDTTPGDTANTSVFMYNSLNPAGSEQDTVMDIYNVRYRGTPPLEVLAINPRLDAVGVMRDGLIWVAFNNDIDSTTLNDDTIILKDGLNRKLPCIGTYDSTAKKFNICLDSSQLMGNTKYTLTVTPNVKDISGQSISQEMSQTFTTIDDRILNISFTKDNNPLAMIDSGNITATIQVTGIDQELTAILSLYKIENGDSKLVDIKKVSDSFVGEQTKSLLVGNFGIPAIIGNEKYYVKIFVWGDLQTIKSYYPSHIFDENGLWEN